MDQNIHTSISFEITRGGGITHTSFILAQYSIEFLSVNYTVGKMGRLSDESSRWCLKVRLFLCITNTFLIQWYYYYITKSVLTDLCKLLVHSFSNVWNWGCEFFQVNKWVKFDILLNIYSSVCSESGVWLEPLWCLLDQMISTCWICGKTKSN